MICGNCSYYKDGYCYQENGSVDNDYYCDLYQKRGMKCPKCGNEMREVYLNFCLCDICGVRNFHGKFYIIDDSTKEIIYLDSMEMEEIEGGN